MAEPESPDVPPVEFKAAVLVARVQGLSREQLEQLSREWATSFEARVLLMAAATEVRGFLHRRKYEMGTAATPTSVPGGFKQ